MARRKSKRQAVQYRRVSVSAVAPGGWGIAAVGRERLFIWGGLPGDCADVQVVRRERGRIEAVVEQVHARAVETVAPVCGHYAVCGGCLWQHVAYQDQLELKADLVRRCFSECGLDATRIAPVMGCDAPFFYRNKMDFAFGPDGSGGSALGLFVSPAKTGTFGQPMVRGVPPPVFDIETCALQSEMGNRIVSIARMMAQEMGGEDGVLRSLVIREGKQTGQMLVVITARADCREALKPLTEAVMAGAPDVRGVVLLVNAKRSKNTVPQMEVVLGGQGWIWERILGCEVRVSPTSFLQVNTAQAERLYQVALDWANLTDKTQVLDLYCGTGTLSLLAAQRAADVIGVEVVAPAIEDARLNAQRNDIANSRFVCGDVLNVAPALSVEGLRPDVVLVNPPRAGIFKAVVRQVCALGPERIVYISCNPETLARDLVRFGQNGYEMAQAQPVDMFPHTPHVEVVAVVTRKSKGSAECGVQSAQRQKLVSRRDAEAQGKAKTGKGQTG